MSCDIISKRVLFRGCLDRDIARVCRRKMWAFGLVSKTQRGSLLEVLGIRRTLAFGCSVFALGEDLRRLYFHVYGGSKLLFMSTSQGTQEQSTVVQVQPQAGAPHVRGGRHGQAAEDHQGAFEASIGRRGVGG